MSYLVATPQGYRRKIGPRSRYGSTPDESAYQRTPTMADRVNRNTQMTGTAHRSRNPHAEREAMEVAQRETADRYLFDQEKRKANQASKREEDAKIPQQPNQEVKDAAGVAAYGTGKPPSAGVASVMDASRLKAERAARAKQVAAERTARAIQAAAERAKGRAKYEAEKKPKPYAVPNLGLIR